jgi:hypothetical protein
MDVRHALLSVLATVPLTGCPSVWNCHPPEENFDLDEQVTAERLDKVVLAFGVTSWDELSCEDVCSEVYEDVRGWEALEVTTCELTLPENPDGSGAAGKVVCSGRGIEYFCEGRRPLGHAEAETDDCLAAMASLEAASVVAFEQLATQLEGFGAAPSLIDRCRAAADDERAHARWLTALAEQRGASVPTPLHEPAPASLLEVALHNAVEGCVHETFAALLAMARAQLAPTPTLRMLFAKLGADETRHGQLAWDIHVWLLEQLETDAAKRVIAAQREALRMLPARAGALADASRELGTPPRELSEALAVQLSERLAA